MAMRSRTARSSALRISIGYLLALAALLFAGHYVFGNWSDFAVSLARIEPWRILLSLLVCLIGLAVNSFAFVVACRGRDVRASARNLSGAWLGSLLSKYVPIGIGHIVGRGVILARFGVGARTTLEVGLFEQVASLIWCALISALTLALSWHGAWGFAAIIAVSLFGAAVLGFSRCRGHYMLEAMSFVMYGLAMVPYCLAYLIVIEPIEVSRFIGALFAGTVAGVAAFFVPSGLGIREAVASLLLQQIDAANVMRGMIAVRAVIVLSEIIASTVGQLMLKRARNGS